MLEQEGTNENKDVIKKLNNTDIKSVMKDGSKPTFVNTFLASIIDLIIIGVVSTVIVYATDAVLKLSGYAIAQKFQMTFIIFMVVMVLYTSIMESGKTSATFGKKVSGLIITKR